MKKFFGLAAALFVFGAGNVFAEAYEQTDEKYNNGNENYENAGGVGSYKGMGKKGGAGVTVESDGGVGKSVKNDPGPIGREGGVGREVSGEEGGVGRAINPENRGGIVPPNY